MVQCCKVKEKLIKSKISHIELNVSDYVKSLRFYDLIFPSMGIKRINCNKTWTAYSDGQSKIVLCPTPENYKKDGFHRKKTGLNHLAFYAETKEDVDKFQQEVLTKNGIKILYEDQSKGDDEYYSIFFEDPDRMKIEYVYAPNYCDPNTWPSNIHDDFAP